MNEPVYTLSEIRAAQRKAVDERAEKIAKELDGKSAFVALIMTAVGDCLVDRVIEILTGNEKA